MLYEGIKWSVSCEAGSVVDLEHQRLEILCDENIETQNVKAHVTRVLLWLAVAVLMAHEGSAR